jgi:hypothetical protein
MILLGKHNDKISYSYINTYEFILQIYELTLKNLRNV